MQRGNLDDLSVFLIVAREGSFTKAAAKLGISQSALSYTIKELEARLKLRLLTRTTRSVSLTEAGERLVGTVAPRIEEIEAEVAAVSDLRAKPTGTIRITATEHAADESREARTPTLQWQSQRLTERIAEVRVGVPVGHDVPEADDVRNGAGIERAGRLIECPADPTEGLHQLLR